MNDFQFDEMDDPVVTHSLRESKTILMIWLIGFLWVVGYCYFFGYPEPGESITIIMGMPSWVFWGVALPWVLATAANAWIALFGIAEDNLEDSSGLIGSHDRGLDVTTKDMRGDNG